MAGARHNERVGVLVEYKFQEPRARLFVESAVKWMKGPFKVVVRAGLEAKGQLIQGWYRL